MKKTLITLAIAAVAVAPLGAAAGEKEGKVTKRGRGWYPKS